MLLLLAIMFFLLLLIKAVAYKQRSEDTFLLIDLSGATVIETIYIWCNVHRTQL